MDDNRDNKEEALQAALRSAAIDLVVVIEALASAMNDLHHNPTFHEIVRNSPYLQEKIGALASSMTTTGSMGVLHTQVQVESHTVAFEQNLIRLRGLLRDLIIEHRRISQEAASNASVASPLIPANPTLTLAANSPRNNSVATGREETTPAAITPDPLPERPHTSSAQSGNADGTTIPKKPGKKRSNTTEDHKRLTKKKSKRSPKK